jgi:S1-C subfamily serine protease
VLDMTSVEELSKTQIILLTLLISFITSIATGIITTSLLAQAPQSVTQTIDRVVERTVEQVAPSASSTNTTVREVTVVNVDDAIQSALGSALPSLVRITTPPDSNGNKSFYALGSIVSSDGLIVTDKRTLIANGSYTVTVASGTSYPAVLLAESNVSNIALLKVQLTPSDASRGLPSLKLASADAKLGQTVIALEGESANTVAVGRVLSEDGAAGTVTTDITASNETAGGPLINLSGQLVGLKSSKDDGTLPASVYTSLDSIQSLISQNATAIQ